MTADTLPKQINRKYVFELSGTIKKTSAADLIYAPGETVEQAIASCEGFASNLLFTGKKWELYANSGY